jgi:UDP-N-acetylmuramate--alanine ligase
VLYRYFKKHRKEVSGYKTPTALTKELIESGINIHFEDRIDLIPNFYPENTLVIVTPAVPKTHSQWNYFRENFNKKKSRSIRYNTKDTFCFAAETR